MATQIELPSAREMEDQNESIKSDATVGNAGLLGRKGDRDAIMGNTVSWPAPHSCEQIISEVGERMLRRGTVLFGPATAFYAYPELACGHVIGQVELHKCIRTADVTDISQAEREFGDYGPGRFAWLLYNPRFLPKPIPARGSLGLWNFEL
jgi:hypothetical protein